MRHWCTCKKEENLHDQNHSHIALHCEHRHDGVQYSVLDTKDNHSTSSVCSLATASWISTFSVAFHRGKFVARERRGLPLVYMVKHAVLMLQPCVASLKFMYIRAFMLQGDKQSSVASAHLGHCSRTPTVMLLWTGKTENFTLLYRHLIFKKEKNDSDLELESLLVSVNLSCMVNLCNTQKSNSAPKLLKWRSDGTSMHIQNASDENQHSDVAASLNRRAPCITLFWYLMLCEGPLYPKANIKLPISP